MKGEGEAAAESDDEEPDDKESEAASFCLRPSPFALPPASFALSTTSSMARSETAISNRSASRSSIFFRGVSSNSGSRLRDSGRSQTPSIGQPRRRQVAPNAHAARPPPRMPSVYTPSMRALILALLAVTAANAAPPTTCGAQDEYGRALCAYQQRRFADADVGFRRIVEKNEPVPQTLRSIYFLARTEMKT